VASDSFMVNLHSVLLSFAEPFMDANYTKVRPSQEIPPFLLSRLVQMDRIDPLYYARSSRINLKDETRIKATGGEASEWEEKQRDLNGSLLIMYK
jgi:ubiquitin conjugation factor E4 B